MSIVRIYQGRVSRIQTLRSLADCACKPAQHGTKPEHWADIPDGEAALWAHHEFFQNAVNAQQSIPNSLI